MNCQEIIDDPTWVPVEVTGTDMIIFRQVDRVQCFSSRYLYGENTLVSNQRPRVEIPVVDFDALSVPKRIENVHRIYHMSYGGSTILQQLLNIPGKCQTFNELRYTHRLDVPVLDFKLGQRIIPGEQHVLKTLPATITKHDRHSIPGDKAILLVPTLRNFIASVYSDETQYRHGIIESMAYAMQCDGHSSLIETCIDVWVNIIRMFNDIATRFDTMTIHSDDLLFHPELALPKVFEFLDIEVNDEDIESQMILMNTHSKTRKPIPNRVEFLLQQRERYMKNCVSDMVGKEEMMAAVERSTAYVNVLRIDP